MITIRESFEESDDRQFADYFIDRNGSPVNRDENEQLHKLDVSGQFYCVSSDSLVYGNGCEKWCGDPNCKALIKQ